MKFSPFSVILIFIALMMAGLALLSRLSVNLYPSETLPSFRISFTWPEMPALTVEREVSSKLEAALGMLNGIKEISSLSTNGGGHIHIAFNKDRDTDMTRFEIASAIRQLYPALPPGVTYPNIVAIQATGSRNSLLLYTLTIPGMPPGVNHYLDELILPALAHLHGINNVAFFGTNQGELNLVYDEGKLCLTGISPSNIALAVNNCLQLVHAGMSYEDEDAHENGKAKIPVLLRSGFSCLSDDMPSLPIKMLSGRVIYLGDVSEISYRNSVPRAYYRINGQSTLLIAVDAVSGENRIKLASMVKNTIAQIQQDLPKTWVLQLAYDDTAHIRNDLGRVGLRMLFSLSALLFLVLLITRNHQYLVLVMLTIAANLFIAITFYYLFNIEIHLYSLAGITVSFGLLIDNSIVMIEHLRRHNNKAAFLAILAATLTTAASIVSVFLLDASRQAVLKDFAAVMLVNMLVSLLVAWFFIPSACHYSKRLQIIRSKPKRCLLSFSGWYLRWLHVTQRYRHVLIVFLMLAFGLPVQYLPARLPGDGAAIRLYNVTLGNDFYQANIKHGIEKVLGGAFRLFANNVFRKSYYVDPERTSLLVRARMPGGSNVHQLNEAVVQLEKYLMRYPQIEQFQTRVLSHDNAYIRILFKPDFDNEVFPVYLQRQLADKAISLGSAEWQITGAGKGFSNVRDVNAGHVSITLEGYNYEMLYRFAQELKMLSGRNPRITNQTISSSMPGPGVSEQHEIVAVFDPEQLAFLDLNANEVLRALHGKEEQRRLSPAYHNDQLVPMVLVGGDQTSNRFYDVKNNMVKINDLHVRPNMLMAFDKRPADAVIRKNNQQYRLFFHFDFNGPCRLMEHVSIRLLEDISAQLPVGYHAGKPAYGWMEEQNKDYHLILIVIVIIFVMCAILFESLRLPLAVVCMIPVSFIGLFLTFYVFDLNFDQGGLAAFLLLSGLSVNAALYLLNDYMLFRKKFPDQSPVENYLKALDCKLMPISLTVLSTVAGMIPFVIGKKEAFWFAFAAGTIGGILFSFCAVLFFLPLFLNLNTRKFSNRKISADHSLLS